MPSIFDGTDALIHEALKLGPRQSLKQKSTCTNFRPSDQIIKNIKPLIFEMYAQIGRNWSGRIPSNSNWKLRRQTNLHPDNRSPEVLLERAIVILSECGLLDGWFNQMPITSGLIDDVSDKRAAVDLVHMDGNQLELVELKWESDTPLYAIFEILQYGLIYLFCFKNRETFGFTDLPTMKVSKVLLSTLAPAAYYSCCDLAWVSSAVHSAVQSLFAGETQGKLSCEFICKSFPLDFALPFNSGSEVLALRDLPSDHPSIAPLLDAMNGRSPAWAEFGEDARCVS